jgi:hypothetical protein
MNGERLTIREAARQRQPLGGPDAQALEHALTQLERRCAALEALIWEFAERRGDFIESDETHWVKLREMLERRIAEAKGK